MAERLARVYGTEMDKVNCPFYYKMGACRYGDSCERIHNQPPISETLMLKHLYENTPVETALTTGNPVSSEDAEKALNRFQEFYEDVFRELSNYGEIEEMIVVDNLGDHIVGNTYVKFSTEEFAENAYKNINGRFFNGKKIDAHYSPVTDFGNAKCKQYLDGSCKRGGYCNYMHIKPLSRSFKKELFAQMYLEHPEYRIKKESVQRSRSRDRERDRKRYDDRNRGEKKYRERTPEKRQKYQRSDRDRKKGDRDKDRDRKKKHQDSEEEHRQKAKKRKSPSASVERNSEERRAMIEKWNAQN